MLPSFPAIAGSVSTEGNAVIVEDELLRRRIVIEVTGDPHLLASLLRRCDGGQMSLEGAGLENDEVIEALAHLVKLGALRDGRSVPERVLAQAVRSAPVSEAEIRSTVREPRWRDPRAPPPRTEDAPLLPGRRRAASIPLDASQLPHHRASISAAEIQPILASAYGSDGATKPVPSAGRLWPLSLHLWCTKAESPTSSALWWFDDDAIRLHPVGVDASHLEMADWFVQRNYLGELLARGASLILISVDLSRIGRKYGNRSVLYAAAEAGAVMELIALDATDAKLSVRPIGGFAHLAMKVRCGIDIEPLLIVAVARTSAS